MNFAYRIPLLSVLLSSLLLCAGSAFGGVPMPVVLNKSVLLTLNNPARVVTVGDPDVISVPDPLHRRQLLINGRKIGTTNLIVWEENVDQPTFFDIRVVGDRDLIESQIREFAPDDEITVHFVKDTVVLTGSVTNEMSARKAEEVAKAYSAKVMNYLKVDAPQQVLLQVKVAQVDKTAMKRLGISTIVTGSTAEGFTNLVGAPSNATSGGARGSSASPGINGRTPGLGGFDPLDAFQVGVSYFPAGIGVVLQALSTKGLAKILAEPNLMVKSGEEGNFLAGSRIPYNVLVSTGGVATSSIVFETVGIKLRFRPDVMESGMIRLKIDPAEVSSIAGTLAVNGYPIIDTRDVRTTVELREGESLVLAGLLQEEQIKIMSKIPLLGDIPILGALFRSSRDDLTEKELVFFITPRIERPAAPGTAAKLPTDHELTPEEEAEFDWMPSGR